MCLNSPPRTGALGLSVTVGAGMLSVSIILPFMGKIYDTKLAASIPRIYSIPDILNALEGTKEFLVLTQSKVMAGAETLRIIALLPAFLVLAFLFLYYRTKKIQQKER